jgi:hypothetical protein
MATSDDEKLKHCNPSSITADGYKVVLTFQRRFDYLDF